MSRDRMPWDAAADDPSGVAPRTTSAPRRAALALWVTAAVQLVLFGGCAIMFTAAGIVPEGLLRDELSGQVPDEQIDQLVQSQPALLISALVLTLVMFLPALVLLVLGFAVRQLSVSAIRFARAILLLQAALIAVVLVIYAIGGLTAGDVAAICISTLLLGGTLALIIWSLRALGAAQRESTSRQDYENEPWNEPMT